MDLHNELLAMREAMTPTSRAEKVARETVKLLEIWKGKPAEYQMAVANVTKALEDYAREAVESRKGNPVAGNPSEWFCLDCRELHHISAKQAFEKGASSMREKILKAIQEVKND